MVMVIMVMRLTHRTIEKHQVTMHQTIKNKSQSSNKSSLMCSMAKCQKGLDKSELDCQKFYHCIMLKFNSNKDGG